MPDTVPIAVDKLAELHDRNRDLAAELNTTIEERDDARDLLDGARLAFRAEQAARLTAEAELAELLDAARRALDGRLHAAVIRQADLDNLDRLDVIVARLVPTRGKGAGCSTSPEDPQSAATREGGPMSG